MTLAKNAAPRRRTRRPRVSQEEARSERIVVLLRPPEMEAVRAFMATQHIPLSLFVRQRLLAEVAAAQQAAQEA
jgi:hypothetical protein